MPHRRSSPPLLSPPLLIILFPIVTLTLLFLAVPPLLSVASRLLRPASVVKTSWDSLNILLVVFAIICGVFARRNDDEPAPPDPNAAFRAASSSPPHSQWFAFHDNDCDNDNNNDTLHSPATGANRFPIMRRNSSSYPDLRQFATEDDGYKLRFFDDHEIDKHFRSPSTAVDHCVRLPELHQQQKQEDPIKEIPVDTEVAPAKSPAPPPPPPPPPPPLESSRRRTHRKIERDSEITVELNDSEFTPPPVTPSRRRAHRKIERDSEITVEICDSELTPHPAASTTPSAKERSERKKKKSNVKREIAMVWASVLSNQRNKKKKQRAKDNHSDDYDDNVDELPNNATLPPPTPPPPPPPPPPSVFHTFFRKGLGKSKKVHSVSPPPPPPPPPPSKRKSRIPPPTETRLTRNSGRPPLPTNRTVNLNYETVSSGSQSPLIPVPPPPPPFKVNAMKFVVRGDFVKIRSNQSSRCSSPERDDIYVAEGNGVTHHNGNVDGSVFCPSPDVNVKATTFIARLRGEWRLEKLNSLKEKSNASLPHRL
ncbi:hypothetical protein Fmac_020664 [Flemingia macrophylla]|uniref:Uncharacterized protein n=1 Tax=Flemingia macrophylla TaxID=520843 RepID=A0ABD1LUM4_9FABA